MNDGEPSVEVIDHTQGRWLCRIRTPAGYVVEVAQHGDLVAVGGSGGAWTPPADLPHGRQTRDGHEDAEHIELQEAMLPHATEHDAGEAIKTCRDWATRYPHFAQRLSVLYWARPDVFKAMMLRFVNQDASAREIARATGAKRSTLSLHAQAAACDIGQRGSAMAQRARRCAERLRKDASEFIRAIAWHDKRKGKA